MKRSLLLASLLAVSAFAQSQAPALQWRPYDTAFHEAKTSGRVVLMYFYSSKECEKCRDFKRNTLNDPKVISYLKDNLVLTKLDSESPNELLHHGKFETESKLFDELNKDLKTHEDRGVPTTEVWSADESKRVVLAGGDIPPDEFITALRNAKNALDKEESK